MKRPSRILCVVKWFVTSVFVLTLVLLWATGWVRALCSKGGSFWSLEAIFRPPNPFWLPAIIVGAATALLWYADRRRFPLGYCRNCGYDLTGNVSGRCPECGEEV